MGREREEGTVKGAEFYVCAACGREVPYGKDFFLERGRILCSEECREKGKKAKAKE